MHKSPEDVRAVYLILSLLRDWNALAEDPIHVEMTRKDYPSVHPLRKSKEEKGKLDITQIHWALVNRKWWFNGPIEILRIGIPRNQMWENFDNDIETLEIIAKEADVKLEISLV